MYAWVTSASVEDHVDKAVVLAASLRRVRTAMKLVVIASSDISDGLRDKLANSFDFVVDLKTMGKKDAFGIFAKVRALSLLIFEKCMYLAPTTLVLNNCDIIFDEYDSFAWRSSNLDGQVDLSVFMFTPSLNLSETLEKKLGFSNGGNASTTFAEVIKNNVDNVDYLDEKYMVPVSHLGCHSGLSQLDRLIVNFVDIHPLDMGHDSTSLFSSRDGFVKQAAKLCLEIETTCLHHNGSKPRKWPMTKSEPIAIIGMSFRLPGANTPDEFWNMMIEGRHGITRVPPHRWTKEHSLYQCGKQRDVEAGFLDGPIDEFDAKFFGISAKEATLLDPQQRLLHEVSWEALEDAGIDPLSVYGTQTGFFVGSWMYNYRDIAGRSPNVDFFRVYMGNSIGASSARLSHFFGCTGPSIPTESGCSSAIVAVDMACKALRNRDTPLALACGVNLLLHPFAPGLLEGVISSDYRCKTFDANANGFVRAEACATLVMKRLSDAVRDGDNIWGLIRGSAITQEGVSKSLGTPTIHGESLAMKLALKDGGVHPRDVAYIETHGTGTPVGDPLEVSAINQAYDTPNRESPLIIGSVKTNVGHTESVSGITGIIKVLVSMKNECIPPHLNLETINPDLQLDVIPAQIPLTPVPWARNPNKIRLAGVSSFGITGTDGHTIIEEPPVEIKNSLMEISVNRSLHIMKVSAKSEESFQELLSSYQNLLELPENHGNFPNIAFSANTGRATFNHRAVIIAKDSKEAAKIIKDKTFKFREVQSTTSQHCFLFTGQGSQYPGMAKELYFTSPVFQMHFDNCDRILNQKYNISIRNVIWGPNNIKEDLLNRTLYSQTSIFCVEYCLLKLWESWGVKPDYVMGHSLGEFAAAVAAGALDFEDGLMLVAERSKLIDSLPTGKMLVIKANKKVTEQTILKFKDSCPSFWVDYAAVNSPDQTVVAGDSEMIQKFASFCAEESLKAIVLASTHAFHSRHMDPMLEAYRKVASAIKTPMVKEGSPKYISGMEGKMIDIQDIDADYWVRHTREKVSFMEACKTAQTEGCILFLEIGPHPVLSALAMMNMEGTSVTCLPSIRRKEANWSTLLESLGRLHMSSWKGSVDWRGFDSCYQRHRVKLPFYPFNRKPIWVHIRPERIPIHPLIGKLIPTASNQTIFENEMTVKGINFSQDHVFGNTVVFPGAGFLEMCLAAGYASAQGFQEEMPKPRRAIALSALKIVTPLALYDVLSSLVQTMTKLDSDKDTDSGYEVRISRHVSEGNGSSQWISHATANFLPVYTPRAECVPGDVDIPKFQDTNEPYDFKEFYEKIPELGLRFGAKFQSMEAAWRGTSAALISLKIPDDHDSYLIHPVIADGMLQAALMWLAGGGVKTTMKKKLLVPLSIQEFVYLERSEDSKRFVYCWTGSDGKPVCALLDSLGKTLAYMTGMEFVETTLKMLEGMIKQQSSAMPKLWEELWKHSTGPLQRRLEPTGNPYLTADDPLIKELAHYNDVADSEKIYQEEVSRATQLFVIKALYNCGWRPVVGVKFTTADLLPQLEILPTFTKFVCFFLRLFASSCGELTVEDENCSRGMVTFWFSSPPPILSEVRSELEAIISKGYMSRLHFRFVVQLGEKLEHILTGKEPLLPLLFPDDQSKLGLPQVYETYSEYSEQLVLELYDKVIIPVFLERASHGKQRGTNPVVRILEVGAGTGVYSRRMIKHLESLDLDYEYFYTDISAAFFASAEKDLGATVKGNIIYKKLNMEEDPLEQGFCPEYFDLIVACEVLHVSKTIRNTLRQLRVLLKPGGCFHIEETISQDPIITFNVGLLEGYWGFQDFELRPNHITVTGDKWRKVLEEMGYEHAVCMPSGGDIRGTIFTMAGGKPAAIEENKKYSWILFGDDDEGTKLLEKKLVGVNRQVFSVTRNSLLDLESEENTKLKLKALMEEASAGGLQLEGMIYMWGLLNPSDHRDQRKISLPFVTLIQYLSKTPKVATRVIVVTQGVFTAQHTLVTNPSPGSLVGMVRSVINEIPNLNVNLFDLSPNGQMVEQVDQVFYNLWTSTNEQFAFRGGKRLSYKVASFKIPNDYLTLPNGCDRFQLALPASRQISDLEFTFLDHYALEEDEIEVEVKAMGLNFRDLFTVLKPIAEFDTFHALGIDFAGVVTKVGSQVKSRAIGDRVMGARNERNVPLPSHLKIKDALTVQIPDGWTFEEGSTLGLVFLTTYFSLVMKAKMKNGDKILVHTASGGVGLCAIQLAKRAGAEVIATAGSERKRAALKRLGVEHVFNSRSTEFEKEVMEVTGGRGVDILLNTLTGPGFKEASLNALATSGQFIELSILNIWTSEEVQQRRPDVRYHTVDLSKVDPSLLKGIGQNEFREYLNNCWIKPIPYERFDALNIRGALNYLQKAKHIGKIVCVMPEVKTKSGKKKYLANTPMFNELSTYVVTGGLGGIGFEVVKWILSSGGKHVVIVSRSRPQPQIKQQIDAWNKSGSHVEACQVDVGNWEQIRELFERLSKSESGFPQIRGIWHAAGVLADALLQDQSWNSVLHTYNPKVYGTWNLHDLTKDMLLEHFVLFSSMSATFGTPGQVNHSSSNSFEDALAAYRHSHGLPATSINWGNWGEVGVATEIDFPGIHPLSTSQGILSLEMFLRTQRRSGAVANIDSFAMLLKVFPILKTVIDDKRLFGDQLQTSTLLVNSDEFWAEVDKAEDRDGKVEAFKKFIKITLRNILKSDPNEVIDDHAEFSSIGVDSLMMLEMKNGMQQVFGSRMTLTASQLKDCNTVDLLANKLVAILLGEGEEDDHESLPSPDELKLLVRADSVLPETIRPVGDARKIFDNMTVLLTGVTGTLGPYMLRELSERVVVSKIYCLIRPSKNGVEHRLNSRLEASKLLDHVNMEKVECIAGDLSDHQFGLSDADYNVISENVDAIIHCAVKSDHIAKYWNAPETAKTNIRTVNVVGTRRILEFAVNVNLKHVYYASSALSMADVDEEGMLVGDWQDVGAFDDVPANLGYPLSKHISEQLLKQAVARGIPCKVFRIPLIGGESTNGRCDFKSSHFYLRCLAIMKLGCMPDIPMPLSAMAVDHCAALSLQVFFNTAAPPDVYNMIHLHPGVDQDLIAIVKEEFGISIEPVSYQNFVEKFQAEDDSSPLAPFKQIYTDETATSSAESPSNSSALCAQKYLENSENFFTRVHTTINKVLPGYDQKLESTDAVVRRDLHFLKDEGVFEVFKIKIPNHS